jgi:hypothetical protein
MSTGAWGFVVRRDGFVAGPSLLPQGFIYLSGNSAAPQGLLWIRQLQKGKQAQELGRGKYSRKHREGGDEQKSFVKHILKCKGT